MNLLDFTQAIRQFSSFSDEQKRDIQQTAEKMNDEERARLIHDLDTLCANKDAAMQENEDALLSEWEILLTRNEGEVRHAEKEHQQIEEDMERSSSLHSIGEQLDHA